MCLSYPSLVSSIPSPIPKRMINHIIKCMCYLILVWYHLPHPLSPEELLASWTSAGLSGSRHLCGKLTYERLQLSTDHIIPLRPSLYTMLGTRGSIVWLVELPARVNHRAVVPPSIKSALPEDIRESNPDPASAWERGDGGGDEGGEGVLLLLAVHGGQAPTLLHAVGQRIQPV